jgi:uncharacterized protein (TIGR03437 family)
MAFPTKAAAYRLATLTLYTCLSALQAQDTITLNPSTVFLNATANSGPVQATVVVASTPGAVGISVAPATASWLAVSQAAMNTPANLALSGNPAGLGVAVYSTLVSVNTPSATVPLEVVMTVNNPSSLTASPSGLIFSYIQGTSTPVAQAVAVSSSSPSQFTVVPTAKWVQVSPTGQTAPGAPGTISISVDPTSVGGPGVYVAGFNITPVSGVPPITVPVVLYYQISPSLVAAPASLSFNFQNFGTNNVTQKMLNLTSTGAPVAFAASVTQGGSWLSVAPTQGATPSALTVTAVQPGALQPGQYQGAIAITSPGTSTPTISVPVALTVSTQPLLDLNISNLLFTYQVGAALPPDQFITPTSTTPNLAYTVTTSTNNTGNWLTTSGSANTPTPVDVAVNPAGLAPGTYMGTVAFNAVAGSNNPQVANVTLNVVNNPTLSTTPTSATGLTFNYEMGQNLPAALTVSVASSGAPLSFSISAAQNSTSNGINWLQVGLPSATMTPASFTVAANVSGMAPGQYTANVTCMTPDGAMQVALPITLNITPAGTPLTFTNPQSMTFNMLAGGTAPDQVVTVNSTLEPVPYSATPRVSTPPGGSWLVLSPPTAPASPRNISSFTVSLNASTLPAGTYRASIAINPNNGTPNVSIPVTLNVTTGNLASSLAGLKFTQASFGVPPVPQPITITSTGAALAITAFASGATWLSVSPQNSTTPASLSVAVNAASLQPGTYPGQLNIISSGAGNSPLTIPVSLTVTTAQSLTVTAGSGASSLTFMVPMGSAAPPAQRIAVTASSGSLPFLANVNITSPAGGNWLSVSPLSATASTTPTNLAVSVNIQGLTTGTYSGSVVISAPNANNNPQTIPMTLVVVAPQPAPSPASVANAGSLQTGPVAPGEIVVIAGTNLGPQAPASGTVDSNNLLATLVSDTQVTFDGVPAPLLQVSATQIKAAVPYEVDGETQTKMIVQYKGVTSAALILDVAASAPGIFLSSAAGVPATQGMVLNEDGSVNSLDNPAPAGSVIIISATGEGQTDPAGVTGLVIADEDAKTPLLLVSVSIGGEDAPVQSAGSAPGAVSGMFQIRALVPDSAPSGATVPIVLSVGPNSSMGGTTVAVQ